MDVELINSEDVEVILDALQFERAHWVGIIETRRRISKVVKAWARDVRVPELNRAISAIEERMAA